MSKYMSMYNESCISMKSQCESCCVVLNIIKSHAVTYLVMYLYYAYWPKYVRGMAYLSVFFFAAHDSLGVVIMVAIRSLTSA